MVLVCTVNAQLCSSVVDQLTLTADSVVQLYKRLAEDGQQDAASMLANLRLAVSEAQHTLRLVVDQPSRGGPGDPSSVAPIPPTTDQAAVAIMMQQYSDLLLAAVQHRMGGGEGGPK